MIKEYLHVRDHNSHEATQILNQGLIICKGVKIINTIIC